MSFISLVLELCGVKKKKQINFESRYLPRQPGERKIRLWKLVLQSMEIQDFLWEYQKSILFFWCFGGEIDRKPASIDRDSRLLMKISEIDFIFRCFFYEKLMNMRRPKCEPGKLRILYRNYWVGKRKVWARIFYVFWWTMRRPMKGKKTSWKNYGLISEISTRKK